jgi:meso-butanediol dehydrogenase/(S,S)-butanediol dehydrogenase/diacetyl reductase
MNRFGGLVALVSGGGSGIGAATARQLAREGARVAVLGRRPGPIEAVALEVKGIAIPGDASSGSEAAAAVSAVLQEWGRLDVVVANAGGGGIGSALETDDAAWTAALTSNLTSAFVLTRAALPALIDNAGSIVVVASMAGLFAPAGAAGYVAGKHGVVGLTRSLARDYGPHGVRVNAVCPGWTRSELSEHIIQDVASNHGLEAKDVFRTIAADVPLGRIAEPAEVAQLICFLASPDASILTGCVIPADGGASTVDAASLVFQRLMAGED